MLLAMPTRQLMDVVEAGAPFELFEWARLARECAVKLERASKLVGPQLARAIATYWRELANTATANAFIKVEAEKKLAAEATRCAMLEARSIEDLTARQTAARSDAGAGAVIALFPPRSAT